MAQEVESKRLVKEPLGQRGDRLAESAASQAVYLAGKHVPPDLPRARDLVRRSADAGNPTGLNIYIQLLELGVGGEADWQGAVDQLRGLART